MLYSHPLGTHCTAWSLKDLQILLKASVNASVIFFSPARTKKRLAQRGHQHHSAGFGEASLEDSVSLTRPLLCLQLSVSDGPASPLL